MGKFFESGDIIIGETGTSGYGLGASPMTKEGMYYFTQTVYGSIGFATGAAVGAFETIKEGGSKYKRGILITGEGSFHLTAQACSDMLRWGLQPIM
jgi:pyruvate decarboxylase